jgi:FkbM family methyltransferase
MIRVIARLPNYLRSFGLLHGIRLFLQVGLHRPSGQAAKHRKLRVPGFEAPIILRDTIADHAAFWQCLVKQQYDFSIFPQASNIAQQYQRLLEQGETPLIIDCGGNIGLTTLWLSARFPRARIVTLEPDDDNFALVQANNAHLGERHLPLNGGIWNRSAGLRIINPESGAAAYRVEEVSLNSEEAQIRAYTVDEVCELTGSDEALYVKIDIEGAQAALFESNTDWVTRTWLISVELDDWLFPWQGTSQSLFRTLSRYPFDYLMRDESIFCFRKP